MENETKNTARPQKVKCSSTCSSGMGCLYGLGFIGAVVYYIQVAEGFGQGLVGFLKALVWPAFLVYDILQYLGS